MFDSDSYFVSFSKVKSVHSIDTLVSKIEQFESRWLRTVNDFFSTEIFKLNHTLPDRSLIELNGSFLFMQLLLDILLRMKPLSTDKDEFIVECMKEYRNQPTTLQNIQDFSEFYEENTALFWYTRPIFLYPLLNKALRVENTDLLFLCRFLVRDIRDQLAQNQCVHPVRVYRGQRMSEEELLEIKSLFSDRSNATIYVCTKSFFSTSMDRSVAEVFVAGQPDAGSRFILFEIDADPTVCNQFNPFAQLDESSAVPDEKEILFMMSSIFQITDIREDGLKCIISIKLCSNDDDAFRNVFECLKRDFGGEVAGYETEANLNSFATILFNMGRFDLADKLFRRLYNELPPTHGDRARYCHNIGNAALERGQYRESLRWLNRALNLYAQTWPPNHPISASTYHCIGNLHETKREYRPAIDAYRAAMDRFRWHYGDDHPRVALCYASIASVYFRQKNFDHAVSLYRTALIINEKCLSSLHPDLAYIHFLLSLALEKSEQRDLAFEHSEKALTIALKTFSSNDVRLSLIYAQMGEIYRKMGNVENSMDCFTKAAAIKNHLLLGSRIRPNDKIHYACRRCQRYVWTYAVFDRIKETFPVCFIFHSKLAFWLASLRE